MNTRLLNQAVALSLLITALSPDASADVVIARRGKAAAKIVVAAGATETEKYAAGELAFFLHIVTGANFSLAPDAAAAGGRLLVGAEAARLADPNFAVDRWGKEEIVIRTLSNDLILAGGSPRATLYSVYTFLEDVVGCRWWTSTASRMPWKQTLKIESVDFHYVPPLEYREPFWFVAFDPVWDARIKANGAKAGGEEIQGGRHIYEEFVHTFYALIPPEKYFRDHPEWFSEIKGQRTHQNAQLCLTNEAMRRELVKNLRECLRLNPGATIASVSQNDCYNNCTCPLCRAVDEEEGSPSGSLLRFVNAVAAEIEPEFPHLTIDTLAYQYTRKPPRLTRPRANVIVRLCSIECSFRRRLDDERNRAFFADLKGWSNIADRLFVWDYTTNFAHYIQPHPNYHVLGPNIRIFVENKVRGIFEQGVYQSTGAEMAEFRAWLLAKLLWNPSLDPQKLRAEFLSGYYGPAAKFISNYMSLLEGEVQGAGDHLGCYSPPDANFLSLDNVINAWHILKNAEQKVKGTLEYGRRVRAVQMPMAYVVLVRWEAFQKEARERNIPWPWPQERQAWLDWFLQAAQSEKVGMISEGQTLEDWAGKGGKSR